MRQGHDLHYNHHLSSALNFLSEEETESLVSRLQGRMARYKEDGVLDYQDDIFTVRDEAEVDLSAGEIPTMLGVVGVAEKNNDLEKQFDREGKSSDVQLPDRVKLKKVRVEMRNIKYPEGFNEEEATRRSEVQIYDGVKLKKVRVEMRKMKHPDELNVEVKKVKNPNIKKVGGVKKGRRHLEKLSLDPTSLISSGKYNHINLVESFKSKGFCRLCYESCGKGENLKKHETEQHRDELASLARTSFTILDLIYKCDLCPQIPGFLMENLRNSHLDKDHRSRSAQRLVCQFCQESFQPSTFQAHLKSHRTDCNLCYKTFRRRKDLQVHKKRKHLRAPESKVKRDEIPARHICPLCYSQYSSQWNLRRHQRRHQEDGAALQREIRPEELVFPCSDCDLRFLSERLRLFHQNKIHKTSAEAVGKQTATQQ